VLAVLGTLAAATTSSAQTQVNHPAILQWFECRWDHMERRVPDLFMAGYGGVWIPPVSRASSDSSVGYDVFDRFDLGRPGLEVAYGTEQDFRAVMAELHQANALVYVDSVLNHNSGRNGSVDFQAKGGYPGFWMNPTDPLTPKQPGQNWGDFHNGTEQAENPNGPFYDPVEGDLLGLIDIAQETNNQFIRQPIAEGDPKNLPAGSIHNKPDAANARFYPDLELQPVMFFNPGTPNNPGFTPFTFYPFNTDEPLAGDAVADNATGLLMRWTQWMMDEFGVDGFRLDAAKHLPTFFWDTYWDSVVYLRRTTPAGSKVTPYSFVESVEGNGFTYSNYTRKGDGFGNRDGLDLNGAGQLRDLLGAGGFGSWQSVLSAHLDTADDGFNNGTLGANHVFSHDNGSVGNGGALPPLPTIKQQALSENAYVLLRPGPPIVYHNARGIDREFGFFPREGVPLALGLNPATGMPDDRITRLVGIRNMAGRGDIDVLNFTDPGNQSLADVLIFERKAPRQGGGTSPMLLVGVSDRFDAGTQTRNVKTSFAPGTRLHEMTGNAANPLVDPGGQIPEILVVDDQQRVQIVVPNNTSSAGEHAMGYIAYAPTLPSGTLEISGVVGELPPDPAQAPDSFQRLTAVPVVDGDSFDISLTTTQTDPLDANTDDDAAFRIDQGFVDHNANAEVDFPEFNTPTPGFERFLTVNEPLFEGGPNGLYVQTIDATTLVDGFHYITVAAFRHRDEGEAPIFTEWRQVIYLDRVGPGAALIDPLEPVKADQYLFKVRLLDRTANRVHFLWDVPPGQDPLELIGQDNLGFAYDRFEWRKTLLGLEHGPHTLTIVALEVTDTATVMEYDVVVDLCPADFNNDGVLNILDFVAFQNAFVSGDADADVNADGVLNILDFVAFQGLFIGGCP
jgi:glycosidase